MPGHRTGPAALFGRHRDWSHAIEPWYAAYALQGAAVAGMIPVLFPVVVNTGGGAARVGLVMASLSLGGLTAPLWGWIADRLRAHRWLLTSGLAASAISLAAFAAASAPGIQVLLAAIAGIGSAATGTIANLFIVERHPSGEWEQRIGALQTFYGGGQVAGLMAAGLVASMAPRAGLAVASALIAVAVPVAFVAAPTPPRTAPPKPLLRVAVRHGESAVGSPVGLFHHAGWSTPKAPGRALTSPFGVFLALWAISFGGSAAVFSLYPVLMNGLFGVPPGPASGVFAFAAMLGLLLYSAAGRWAVRYGSLRVLTAGLGLRLAALAAMMLLAASGTSSGRWLAPLCFIVVVLAWSLLSVSGTALAAELSPFAQGEAIGLFNAVTAGAGVVGSVAGGSVAAGLGYAAVPVVAMAGSLIGLLLVLGIRRHVPILPPGLKPAVDPDVSVGGDALASRERHT